MVLDERMRRAKARPAQSLRPAVPKGIKRKLRIDGEITVANLAHELGVKAAELVKLLMTMGQPATINQFIDFDTASILAADYNAEIVNVAYHMAGATAAKASIPKPLRARKPRSAEAGRLGEGTAGEGVGMFISR